MPRFTPTRSGEPSQRQLRVGELVRHALAEAVMRGEVGDAIEMRLLTIAEVRMSGDLKHATIFVTAPAGAAPALLEGLNRQAGALRRLTAPALRQLRHLPDLRFRLDTRFEDDRRVDELLRSPPVARDLARDEGDR